jgi:hypothetical protein
MKLSTDDREFVRMVGAMWRSTYTYGNANFTHYMENTLAAAVANDFSWMTCLKIDHQLAREYEMQDD